MTDSSHRHDSSREDTSTSSPASLTLARIFGRKDGVHQHGYHAMTADDPQEMNNFGRHDASQVPPSSSNEDEASYAPGRPTFQRVPVGSKASTAHEEVREYSSTAQTSLRRRGSVRRSTSAAGVSGVREDDNEVFKTSYGVPPDYCYSYGPIEAGKWLYYTILALSVYSAIMSGLWLVVAVVQPRWGLLISSRGLSPSSATTLSALISKTIEIISVTVFISLLGQMLSRKSLNQKQHGMTMGEMTMRNWVFQPGSLLTHAETIPRAGRTLLGVLSLLAMLSSLLFTTASDALVAPKLKYGTWEDKVITGKYYSTYANLVYIQRNCPALLREEDEVHADESCVSIMSSGQSYVNLMNFLELWNEIEAGDTQDSGLLDLGARPVIELLLEDRTPVEAAWVQTEHSDVPKSFEEHRRIVNNITMAIPHPVLPDAARLQSNAIVQPEDLDGLGGYSVRAAVVSPSLNVMCVDMDTEELSPLVYTEWEHADPDLIEDTGVGNQSMAIEGWQDDIPRWTDEQYLNRTVVDNVFRWGSRHDRLPPVFPGFPADYNMIVNASMYRSDSIYMLAKPPESKNYTLCQLFSFLSVDCSSQYTVTGTGVPRLTTNCGDPDDKNRYLTSFPEAESHAIVDWKWLAEMWRLSMDLNGGIYNNNASNARILTQLALDSPSLSITRPSLAETLAVYASWTLFEGSLGTPFRHFWENYETIMDDPVEERFNASVRSLEYTSGHVYPWQAIFYVVLAVTFILNVFALCYFLARAGLITDFTEPQNLFTLAINSPPSVALQGSCGGGPHGSNFTMPWRVAYASSVNHYFFREVNKGSSG